MKKSNKLFVLFLFLFLHFLGTAQNKKVKEVNTKVNKQYFKSVKSFYGKFDAEELVNLKSNINAALNQKLDASKAILINYYQFGDNCVLAGESEKDFHIIISNSLSISKRISSQYNTVDFFVYSNDFSKRDLVSKNSSFILDSGFFKENIFRMEENCNGFLIIKPNGDYMKYYGGDYYTQVENFLKK